METNRLDVQQLRQYHINYSHPLEDTHNYNQYQLSHQQTTGKRKLQLDTPSTSHGINRIHQKINSLAQAYTKSNEPIRTQEQRTNPKILSVLEIKENENRIKERALSRASVNSEGGRKIFVSISKSNRSDHRKSQLNERVSMSPGHLSSDKGLAQRIKLTKYMQLKGSLKSKKE